MQMHVLLDDPAAQMPAREHAGDAGLDLRCLRAFSLAPGERLVVDTGVRIALPDGHCGLVMPRSGLAAKHGITVVNAPGLIDHGYTGRLQVILLNTMLPSDDIGEDLRRSFFAEAGDKIAQLVVAPYAAPQLTAVGDISEFPARADVRGDGGLGSTGR